MSINGILMESSYACLKIVPLLYLKNLGCPEPTSVLKIWVTFRVKRQEGNNAKKIQSFWNIVSSTKSCALVFFSLHSYYNSNLYCNISIVKWAWLWRQIIFKFEAFCVHQWCWYTHRSAWSNRCDKWHIAIKMSDKIGCRCHPIIILPYTPLLYWGCLLYWVKRIPFCSVRNNSKHRASLTANLSKISSHKQIRTMPVKILKA